MSKYKYKKILKEIDRWQVSNFKAGFLPEAVNAAFRPMESLIDFVIPDEAIEKAVRPVNKILKNLQESSKSFVNTESIVMKAYDAGLEVNDLESLRNIPIEYLDVLAKSFFEKNAVYAAVQGAGLGAAGCAFVIVDIPLLFMLCLKTIFQIGACYGYVSEFIEDKEFALRIFCVITASRDTRSEQLYNIDELIMTFVDGTFSNELSIFYTEKRVSIFINKLVRWFIRKVATRSFPVIGTVLGSSFNYLFIRESAVYAYMLHRKRFVREKLFRK